MEFLKCRDVRWKRREKRNKPNVVATTAKHPDSCAVSHFGGNLLPVAVSEPAVAICLNSLLLVMMFLGRADARDTKWMLCFHVAQTRKHFSRTQCFWTKSETIFVSRAQNLCPQQMVRARANGETMCPLLPGPYSTWYPSRPSEPTVDLWLMPSFFFSFKIYFIWTVKTVKPRTWDGLLTA